MVKRNLCVPVIAVVLAAVCELSPAQTPLGPAFTYQGQLKEAGVPASGAYDLQFRLYDVPTGGTPLGNQSLPGTPVTNGLFSVQLNASGEFGGSAFDGEERWLEVEVNGTPLAPRQAVTAAPYALRALAVQGVDGHSLDAADGDPVDALFVEASGNVGIGTTTPGSPLHLSSTGEVELRLFADTDNASEDDNPLIRFRQDGNAVEGRVGYRYNTNSLEVMQAYNGPLILGTNDLDRLTIDSTGNVGIGTASPTNRLSVSGNANVTGNLGIGTVTPSAKLHLAGTPGTDGILFPDGTLQTTAATGGGNAWSLTGNAGTSSANFLGTIDDVPFNLRVNNARALRVEAGIASPNLIGGYSGNFAVAGVSGAAIGGGGASLNPVWIAADFGTIGGGQEIHVAEEAGLVE